MKKYFLFTIALFISCIINTAFAQDQQDPGYKTITDITVDEIGDAVCEFKTKYNAQWWDFFTKSVGGNTSIIKNNLLRIFPKYELTDFNYTQDADERTNTVKFKILGMMYINKNGKWTADLDQKNPDITKVSDKDFLLIEQGNQLKIHLPPGTEGAKIEKDSFGEAVLTYPANESGGFGKIFLIGGLLMMAAGGFFLYRNMKQPQVKIKTLYEPVPVKEIPSSRPQFADEKMPPLSSPLNNPQQRDYTQDNHE